MTWIIKSILLVVGVKLIYIDSMCQLNYLFIFCNINEEFEKENTSLSLISYIISLLPLGFH
jgi:hypothetical protein